MFRVFPFVRFAGVSSPPGRGECFLTIDRLPERGPGHNVMALHQVSVNCPHGPSVWNLLSLGLPITTVVATPGELPSPRRRHPGGASSRRRVHSPFRLSLIDSRYPSGRVGRAGRRGTFTGQCCQPLCAGDATKHLSGPCVVPEYRRHGASLPGLHRIVETGPPPLPKRDTSPAILTWPLRRHSLPSDPGCIPPPTLRRSRGPPHCPWRGSSEDFRTGSDPPG